MVVVRFSLLLPSFYFTHAQYGYRACALAFIIETHMDYDIQVDNLGCNSRLFHSASHTALTPPLRDRVLASWSPIGLEVFSRRGNRLYSDRELVNVLPEKGKEDCQEPLTVLAAILRGKHSLDPWWFSSTRPWGFAFPLAHLVS